MKKIFFVMLLAALCCSVFAGEYKYQDGELKSLSITYSGTEINLKTYDEEGTYLKIFTKGDAACGIKTVTEEGTKTDKEGKGTGGSMTVMIPKETFPHMYPVTIIARNAQVICGADDLLSAVIFCKTFSGRLTVHGQLAVSAQSVKADLLNGRTLSISAAETADIQESGSFGSCVITAGDSIKADNISGEKSFSLSAPRITASFGEIAEGSSIYLAAPDNIKASFPKAEREYVQHITDYFGVEVRGEGDTLVALEGPGEIRFAGGGYKSIAASPEE